MSSASLLNVGVAPSTGGSSPVKSSNASANAGDAGSSTAGGTVSFKLDEASGSIQVGDTTAVTAAPAGHDGSETKSTAGGSLKSHKPARSGLDDSLLAILQPISLPLATIPSAPAAAANLAQQALNSPAAAIAVPSSLAATADLVQQALNIPVAIAAGSTQVAVPAVSPPNPAKTSTAISGAATPAVGDKATATSLLPQTGVQAASPEPLLLPQGSGPTAAEIMASTVSAETSSAVTPDVAAMLAAPPVSPSSGSSAAQPPATAPVASPAQDLSATGYAGTASSLTMDLFSGLVAMGAPAGSVGKPGSKSEMTALADSSAAAASAVAAQTQSRTTASASNLLAAFAQTMSDAAPAQPDSGSGTAGLAQATPASLSALLQQINDGSGKTSTNPATGDHPATASAPQLAMAAPDAATSTLMPATLSNAATIGSTVASDAAASSTQSQSPVDTTQQNWPDALGSRVEWLLNQGIQEARIELHPHDMGSINVHIRLGDDGADVRFAATNPNVRDALESSLPRLRELLAGGGLQLAQAQVGSQMQQQESGGGFRPQETPAQPSALPAASTATDEEAPQTAAPRAKVAQLSIIDDYA